MTSPDLGKPVANDQRYRTAGGLIDRSRPLSFSFDGRAFSGYAGDTLASALLANGQRFVARSFKYHRPRGFFSAGSEEPNALVTLREGAFAEPNTRATTVELFDGLVAKSQNCWPSLRFDVRAAIQIFGPTVAAGFYYKTFMWPAAFWESIYEPLIRRSAGLGPATHLPDPDRYEKATLHCDVLVVGSGPSGLAAALAAARTGARVVLCEEDSRVGGRLLAERDTLRDRDALEWIATVTAELAELRDVELLTRTTVVGSYDHGVFAAVERVADHRLATPSKLPRQRLWRIVARRTVICTGGIERPLLFENNDLPGVMLAGSVRSYLNRYAVMPGDTAVLYCNNDDSLKTALDLVAARCRVQAVVDPRPAFPEFFARFAEDNGIRLFSGSTLRKALGSRGVRGVEISTGSWDMSVECDLIAISGGWTPNLHLTCHLGNRPIWDERAGTLAAGDIPEGMLVAGLAGGQRSTAAALSSGAAAGLRAAKETGFEGQHPDLPDAEEQSGEIGPAQGHPRFKGKVFVDLQNDVTVSDLDLAHREGYRHVEHLKRYTTLGMGTDQGKTAGVNAVAILSDLTAQLPSKIGVTTFRPPYTPVAIGTLAGQSRGAELKPTRLTPAHGWAREQGAIFIESGLWLRAQYFPRNGEDWLASATREAAAVRQGVGLCDVSTLGKIDIQGPDAAAFLDRVYINSASTLAVGRVRYGVMLREDGFVFDDGTFARFSEGHFVVSTTTANAVAVMRHLELCSQVLWPELDVSITSVTEQWAQFSLAGPRARNALRGIVDSRFDVSDSAFPFMAAAKVSVCDGIPARLFRLSFSGELAYEVAVPARWGDHLAHALFEAGRAHGIVPHGLEALAIMRIEKGHPAGGELNGQTTARDLGLARLMSKKKDFIGRKLAEREALIDPDRPILVGLQVTNSRDRLTAGAHFVAKTAPASAEFDEGFMTSVAYSPVKGCWIGLGLVRRGHERTGETIRAVDPIRGLDVPVTIVAPCFVDPEGMRLRA